MTIISTNQPKSSARGTELRLTPEELMILTNALNEVCNGIDLPEFSTRIGAGRDEALLLLRDLTASADTHN